MILRLLPQIRKLGAEASTVALISHNPELLSGCGQAWVDFVDTTFPLRFELLQRLQYPDSA